MHSPLISILIPVYGRGKLYLDQLLQSIKEQTYKNIEVIIHEQQGAAASMNYMLSVANGDIIKPMFQDDYFIRKDSLEKFAGIEGWGVCTSKHTNERGDHIPYINNDLYSHDRGLAEGCNTYGCPSAVAWERNDLRFDESLVWLFDCEFYTRLSELYGSPMIVDTAVMIREWEGMATRSIPGSVVLQEREYVANKYKDHEQSR